MQIGANLSTFMYVFISGAVTGGCRVATINEILSRHILFCPQNTLKDSLYTLKRKNLNSFVSRIGGSAKAAGPTARM